MHGGLALPTHKAVSTGAPVARGPRPRELVLPLTQHAGAPAVPVVTVGDRVARGQPVAKPAGYVSVGVHAPASGIVIAVEPRAVPHPSGFAAPCIVLATDPVDTDWHGLQGYPQWDAMDPSALRNRIRDAGIAGLGGAVFPTHVKLNPGTVTPVHTLVLNGAECEPYISCDEMLMRERADRIVAGIPIMLRALRAARCFVAVEEDKPAAIAAMETAIASHRLAPTWHSTAPARVTIELVVVPSVYPQGGERQLIRALTGVRVPRDRLPLDVGIVCHNVATAAAVADAILDGEPLTRRLVTITGDAVAAPRNIDALIGTPVVELVAACGGYAAPAARLLMGGPMMGFALSGDQVPVVKATNCVIAARAVTPAPQPLPCIRCGECVEVCPAELLPQQIFWHAQARDFERADAHALFDCIECGCCDAVCPSHIPLVDTFRWAKGEVWKREDDRERAALSKRRHDAREQRLAAERLEREARQKAKQDPVSIDQALARIKAKAGL